MSLVTVLMPMKNAAPYVEAALRTVLDQAVDLEVVVIDDGSTDDSAHRVRGLQDDRLRIVPGPQHGIAAAFNAGLAAARGDIVTRCDADDFYEPGRLERQLRWLHEHPEFGAVCGSYAAVDGHGRTLAQFYRRSAPGEVTDDLRDGATRTSFCTWAVRADLLRQVGGCRTWFATGEDMDLQFRLAGVCRVWFDPGPCYRYRLHEQSVTHTQAQALRQFYETMAKEFARQRREEGTDDLERGNPPDPPRATGGQAPLLREQIQGFLNSRAWKACRNGRRGEALSLGLRALMAQPRKPASWTNFVKLGAKCLWPRPVKP